MSIPDHDALGTFFITLPRLDVYQANDFNPITFEVFAKQLLWFADEWGDKAIGRQVRAGLEIAAATHERTDKSHVIVAIGQFGDRKFAAISTSVCEAEVIEHDWPDALDVA